MRRLQSGNRLLGVLVVVAASALGCGSDDGNGEPDAAGPLDGGTDAGTDAARDAGTDADMTDAMDAGPSDGGDRPQDAEVPEDGASEEAGDDGSVRPAGTCARWERDVDGDGDLDTVTTFFYEDGGGSVIEEQDIGSAPDLSDGADGTPDYRRTTTYDGEGRVASVADDWDADGNDNLITRFDVDGRKTEEIFDVGDDGSVLDRTSYAYREDGELAAKERDSDGDGDADSSTTYVYDDDGKLLRIDEDEDLSDELVNKVTHFEYDEEGRRTQEEVYEGETPARRTTFTYDAEGDLIRREEDLGIDAEIDVIEQWTFESGVLVSHGLDDDGDGLVDERQTFDAEGRVLTDEGYHDGVLDVTTTYEYDGDGNIIIERAEDGAALLLSRKQYAYDASDRPTQLAVDSDGDGLDDMVTRWSYDEHGRLLTVEERRSADPEAPFVVTEDYSYDDEGRLIEATFDGDADGTPDGFERRLYEC